MQAGGGSRPIALSHEQVLPYGIVQPDPDLLHACATQVEEIRLELEPYGIKADCEILIGTSAAKALHEAAESGLLVVGSSHRGARGRVLAGSTAARLLSGSPCPVAVAPHGVEQDELPKTIGVAFRDTEDGREALRGALALARRGNARPARGHPSWRRSPTRAAVAEAGAALKRPECVAIMSAPSAGLMPRPWMCSGPA